MFLVIYSVLYKVMVRWSFDGMNLDGICNISYLSIFIYLVLQNLEKFHYFKMLIIIYTLKTKGAL